MKLRLPEGASQAEEQLAGEAFEVLVQVMRGEVKGLDAPTRRNAAKDVREEICKPLAKQLNLANEDGGELSVSISINGVVSE